VTPESLSSPRQRHREIMAGSQGGIVIRLHRDRLLRQAAGTHEMTTAR
jgi:hypothetical protein